MLSSRAKRSATLRLTAAVVSGLALAAGPVSAQVQPSYNTRPMAVPFVDPIPAAQDKPWPGTIGLAIDASDVTTGAYRVTETIPLSDRTAVMTPFVPTVCSQSSPATCP